MYYSVTINKKSWSAEKISIAEFEKRGYTIQDARRLGDKDVFYNGRKVAILFESKIEAANFALSK
jgi:hypothetical protein